MSIFVALISALVTIVAMLVGCYFLRARIGRSGCSSPRSDATVRRRAASESQFGDVVSEDSKNLKIGETEEKAVETKCFSGEGHLDPVEFCGHLQREIKKAKQRVALDQIQVGMNQEQRDLEGKVRRQQLDEIYRLMEGNKDKFGMGSVEDLRQQMGLYIQ